MIPNRTILIGDILDKLKEIPDNSIHCVIDSPPYWALRDYGVEGQWGLEKNPQEYLNKMKLFMKEIKRVLHPMGSCWINLGDCYGGSMPHSDWTPREGYEGKVAYSESRSEDMEFQSNFIKPYPKSLVLIPWEFLINCRNDGWIVRNIIPWYKSNSMPSSIKDRFSNKWEPIFFMVKSKKYYFNLDAVREKPKGVTKPFNIRVREAKKGLGQAKLGAFGWKMSEQEDKLYDNNGVRKQDTTLGANGKPKPTYAGFNERWKERKHSEEKGLFHYADVEERIHSSREMGADHELGLTHENGKNPGDFWFQGDGPGGKWRKHFDEEGFCLGCGEHWSKHTVNERAKGSLSERMKRTEDIVWCNPKGKNPGDFMFYNQEPDTFFINPKPFPEAHFATFPVELPLKILKCACPEQVCLKCGKPRLPISEPTPEYKKLLGKGYHNHENDLTEGMQQPMDKTNATASYRIVGWTDCGCGDGFSPGTVLDPFFGSGSVGVAAEKLGLNWVGIELKEEYVNIARKRLEPYNVARLTQYF